MANAQLLKRRIRSVANTKQITKAMELVAAAKMRRVQAAAELTRLYSDAAISAVGRLSSSPEATRHPYFTPAASKAKLYVVMTSDSGLAGAYNSNIFNLAANCFKEDARSCHQPVVIAFGRKGAHRFSRSSNVKLLGEYEEIADNPDINVFAPAIETISNGIENGEFGSVNILFTEFLSAMNQKARNLQLLPVPANGAEGEPETQPANIVYELEPDATAVLQSALKLYIESALLRARVEAAASEHAMRMMSMNNANRNAGDLIDNLTLELNATRQAAITQEMAEIIGGAEAIA